MDRLAEIRHSRRLTQAQLAEMAGVDQGHISRLERGSLQVTLKTVYAIADALGVAPVELFSPPAQQLRLIQAFERIPVERRERAMQLLEALVETLADRPPQ